MWRKPWRGCNHFIHGCMLDGWNPPTGQNDSRAAGFQRRMRYKVRAAINDWGLQRLYPVHLSDTEFTPYDRDYAENEDFEADAGGAAAGGLPDP